jgi:hypothetical protein
VKLYRLNRKVDPNGVSGTGIVAHAVEFADGTTVVKFEDGFSAYTSLQTAIRIHGHNGSTEFQLVGEYNGAYYRHTLPHEDGWGHRGGVA